MEMENHQYQDPRQNVTIKLVLIVIPLIVQCVLLHPRFSTRRALRWIRLMMTPFIAYHALRTPIDYCFKPSDRRGGLNFSLCIWGTQIALKSIQFGLIPGFIHGKLWNRKEVALNDFDKSYTVDSNFNRHFSWLEILRWAIKQTFSVRGIQYGWGQKLELDNRRLRDLIKRLIKVHLLSLISTAGCVLTRDFGSATAVLVHIGLPNNTMTKILATGLYSLSFPAFLLSWFDLACTWITIAAHLIKNQNIIGLPEWFSEWFDSRLLPLIFRSPHTVDSLNALWSHAWHQFLRADLIFFAARPTINLAKKLHLSKKIQQLLSLFAVFFMSGILHELYILSAIKSKTSIREYISKIPFPGALFYFMMQPIGIIIEPYIIPRIPKKIGGGTLWVWAFSLAVIIPYRDVILGPYGIIDNALPPFSKWPIYSLFIPGSLYRTIDVFDNLIDQLHSPTLSDIYFHFSSK